MGRALCVMLVEAGCTVAACDIDMAALQGTVAACEAAQPGCTVMIFRCDISDEEACISFSEAVASELGTSHINALFNNTGIGIRRMMNFAFKLMDFALKMMNFVFKMMDFNRYVKLCSAQCGETLFKTGDVGDKLYIVLRGEVEIDVSSKVREASVSVVKTMNYVFEMMNLF